MAVATNRTLLLISCLLLTALFLSSSPSAAQESRGSSPSLPAPVAERSSPLAVEILWNGTVTARDTLTNEVCWSFYSGAPLSSAQGLILDSASSENSSASSEITSDPVIADDEYLFCGTDWRLYSFDKRYGTEGLPVSPDELVRSTPVVLGDSIILGSMSTSAFLVDSLSGALVRTFNHNDQLGAVDIMKEEDLSKVMEENLEGSKSNGHVYIFRRDYTIRSVKIGSGALLWNVSVADLQLYHVDSDDIHYLPASLDANIEGRPASLELLSKSTRRYDSRLEEQNSKTQLAMLPASERGKQVATVSFYGSETNHASQSLIVDVKGIYGATFLVSVVMGGFGIAFLIFRRMKKRAQEKQPVIGKKKKRKMKPGVTENPAVQESSEKSPNMSALSPTAEYHETAIYENTYGNSNNPPQVLEVITPAGKLVTHREKVIGLGSQGTMVFEGLLETRKVAVKRMLLQYHEKAEKEISFLIASDEHPNIVRYYSTYCDADFVYVALERCRFSLFDLVIAQSVQCRRTVESVMEFEKIEESEINEMVVKVSDADGDTLWDKWDRPSPKLLQLMRDIVAGVAHLHDVDIVHRDLKPQNVLISSGRASRAKLSDMGISKRLINGAFGNTTRGAGSSGWQAPEQLRQEQQSKSVDLFSLGCVLFFCISGGRHPYGRHFERDKNIRDTQPDLFAIKDFPEALDLLQKLLNDKPEIRPTVKEVMMHPFFWSSEKRLSFLRDASDRVELEIKKSQSLLLDELQKAFPNLSWDQKVDNALLEDIKQKRRYNYSSIRDLLRVIRNKKSHYRELPQELQELFVSYPDGFDIYFRNKFPSLLLDVYQVVHKHCGEEELFRDYFSCTEWLH